MDFFEQLVQVWECSRNILDDERSILVIRSRTTDDESSIVKQRIEHLCVNLEWITYELAPDLSSEHHRQVSLCYFAA